MPFSARADLSTASYSGKALSVASQLPNGGEALAFSSNGDYLYVTSNYSGTTIYEYTLATPWDITTASYTRSGNAVASGLTGIYFSSDGTKMYALEFYNDILDEYTLSTPWNISTISKTASISVPYGNNYSMTFSYDGTKFYDFNEYTDKMYEYTMTTPWDITTATQTGSATAPSGYVFGAAFSSDGSTLYLVHQDISSADAALEQYNLSTPWNISTAVSASKSFSLTSQDGYMYGLATNPATGSLYTFGGGNGPYDVFWYYMTAPDTTPPTVSLTEPTSGEATSSTMTLAANASDNVAVGGVTFYVDGAKQGSEVTSAPYKISYDTTATSSGTHTAFAVARDTSNNYATSSTVSFTINNLATPSSVAASTTSSSATINWTTPNDGSSQIFFGVSSDLASSTSKYNVSPGVTSHSIDLSNLPACIVYKYLAVSKSLSNETSTSSPDTFTTGGCTGNASITAHNESDIATSSGGTLSQGDLTLTVPAGFTATTSTTTFQASQLDGSTFFSTAGAPSGFEKAGTTVFHLSALTNPETLLTTFSKPLTVKLSYASSDVSNLQTASLWIYRYDSGTWTPLNSCSVNVSADTVTCTTSNFSDFAIFGKALSSSSSVTTSTGSVAYGCTDPRATNYEPWVASDPALCRFPSPSPVIVSNVTTTTTKIITPTTTTATIATTTATSTPYHFTRWLKEGMSGLDVQALQRYLNTHNFAVAASGPGSLGHETRYFGPETTAALINFQNAQAQAILAPLGLHLGTGFFGPSTIRYVNSH